MRTPEYESDTLRELRRVVAGEVLELASEFVEGTLMAHALNEQQISVLREHVSLGKAHPELAVQAVIHFGRTLRPCIGNLVGSVDTRPYWCLIDAAGAVEDSLPQTWRLSNDVTRQARLRHARQSIAEVRELAHDMAVAAEQGDGSPQAHEAHEAPCAPRQRC